MLDACVCQAVATCEVDISDSVARLHQCDDGSVREIDAVSEVNVMKVFRQFANSHDSSVGDVLAFREDKIPKSRCRWNYSSNSIITNMLTGCEIKNSQRIENQSWWQVEKCAVVNVAAVG